MRNKNNPASPGCPEEGQLIDYYYCELDEEVFEQTGLHLETCPVCSLSLAHLTRTLTLTAQAIDPLPVPSPRVLSQLEDNVVSLKPWTRRLAGAFLGLLNRPVPAYQPILAGAALGVVIQLAAALPTSGDPWAPSQAPRQPDPESAVMPVLSTQGRPTGDPRLPLEQTVDFVVSIDQDPAY